MQNPEVPSTAPAVEIAVVLGDSVVAVHHLTDPRGGRTTAATRALFASAALGLIACAVALGIGVAAAGANRRAERAWLDAGNAAIDFHPRRLPPLLDLLAAAGLVTAVAGAAWGLARAQRERRPSRFTVGRGAGVDLSSSEVPVDRFTIVAPAGAGFAFSPAPGMFVDGPTGPIVHGARTRAQLGAVALLISGVAAPRSPAGGPRLDRRALGYGLVSAAVHGVLLVLCLLLPATASGFSDDELGRQVRRTRAVFMPSELRPAPPSTAGALRGAGAEGERGRPEAAEPGKAKVLRVADPARVAPPPDRVALARSAGVLGVMNAQRDTLTVLTATGDFTSGLDDADVRGGWDGPSYADDRGFGTGLRDRGPGGGGGPDPATIGVGPIRTPGTGFRVPGPGLPGRRPRPPVLVIGQVSTPGYADKETIRRHVHSRAAQITWCYEHELVVQPRLAGTVVAEFTIRTDGRVLEASARGLGDASVEQCVADIIRGIAFPAGQLIHVTSYPFTFRPAGGGM